MVQTTNQTQTEKTIQLVLGKMNTIYNESYREREEKGEFSSASEIDYLISKEYYVKYLQSGKPINYSTNQFFGVIYSISAVGENCTFEHHYDEYVTSGLNDDELLSEEQYSELVNIIFQLGNK